jgi:hypothetical protein
MLALTGRRGQAIYVDPRIEVTSSADEEGSARGGCAALAGAGGGGDRAAGQSVLQRAGLADGKVILHRIVAGMHAKRDLRRWQRRT